MLLKKNNKTESSKRVKVETDECRTTMRRQKWAMSTSTTHYTETTKEKREKRSVKTDVHTVRDRTDEGAWANREATTASTAAASLQWRWVT